MKKSSRKLPVCCQATNDPVNNGQGGALWYSCASDEPSRGAVMAWFHGVSVRDHYCPTFSAPQQHLRVWGTRWRGRREQLHQWTAVEQVELENS